MKIKLFRSEIVDLDISEIKDLMKLDGSGKFPIYKFEGKSYAIIEITFTNPRILTEPEYSVSMREIRDDNEDTPIKIIDKILENNVMKE